MDFPLIKNIFAPNYPQLPSYSHKTIAVALAALALVAAAFACAIKYFFSKKEQPLPLLPPEMWIKVFEQASPQDKTAVILASALTCKRMANAFLPGLKEYRTKVDTDLVLAQIPTHWLGNEFVYHKNCDEEFVEVFAGTFAILKGKPDFFSRDFPISNKELKIYFRWDSVTIKFQGFDPAFVDAISEELKRRSLLSKHNDILRVWRGALVAAKLRLGQPLNPFEEKIHIRGQLERYPLEPNLLALPRF